MGPATTGPVWPEFNALFEIRWSTQAATINAKDRLIFEGRTYDISEATEIGRRVGICIKGAARTD